MIRVQNAFSVIGAKFGLRPRLNKSKLVFAMKITPYVGTA